MLKIFKDKKTIIAFIAVLVLLIGVGMALAMNLGQGKIDIAEQLSLGEKYLLEMKYEKAILAFSDVIKVDPKNVRAYLGLAEAYVGKGDIDKAIKTLEKGLELTGDDKIKENLERLLIKKKAIFLLETLYQAFTDNDRNASMELMQSKEYIILSESATHDDFYYYGQTTGNDIRHGIGLGAYPNNYYYYGQWENGFRSGQGLWICVVDEKDISTTSYTYEGNWKNDLPNGEGTIVHIKDENKIEKQEGYTYAIHIESVGTFLDGLEHGTINKTWWMNNGGIKSWSPIIAINGVYQPNTTLNKKHLEQDLKKDHSLVAIAQNGATLSWGKEKNTVRGIQIEE